MNKFFMLYREGGRAPTFKHTERESAEREAGRIAKEHGGPVYVLEAVAKVEVKWEAIGEREAVGASSSKFPGEWVDFDISQSIMNREIDNHPRLLRLGPFVNADLEVACAGSGCRVRARTEVGAEWLEQRKARAEPNTPPIAEQAKRHMVAHGIGCGWGRWLYCVDNGSPIVVCLDEHGLVQSPGSSGLCGRFAFQIGGKWFPLAADGSPLPPPNDDDIPF